MDIITARGCAPLERLLPLAERFIGHRTRCLFLKGARVEPGLAQATPAHRYQFERQGYFCIDSKDSTPQHLVFNRAASLRDSWAKLEKSQQKKK